MNSKLAPLRDLAHALAPEIAGSPLYILRHPPELAKPLDTAAYSVRGAHLQLRDVLRRRGVWRGFGVGAVVFCDIPPAIEARRGLFLHELAHLLPPQKLDDKVEPSPAQRDLQAAQLAAWATADPEVEIEAEPWLGHGLEFTRVCLHLWFRAMFSVGVRLPLSTLGACGCRYGLRSADVYLNALWPELLPMRRTPFREILAADPPEPFAALFAEDVAKWQKRTTKQCQ